MFVVPLSEMNRCVSSVYSIYSEKCEFVREIC